MKKCISGAFIVLLLLINGALNAGAVNFGIFQGHMLDGSLNEEETEIIQGHVLDSALDEKETEIIQGHILDGVTAEDGTPAVSAPDAQSFTITFLPNGRGASVSPKSKRVTNGRAYGELPVPKWDGYVFDGWRTVSGTLITANHVVSLSADQSLYAQWREPTCKVRFDANGGSVRLISIDLPLDGNYGELPLPVRGGYSFEGWHTLPYGGVRVTDYAALTSTEDHTLYAHWVLLPAPEETEEPEGIFEDVPTTSSYYPAVRWAVMRGITSGTSAETFSPNAPCKQWHILTFLWRANGCPEPLGMPGGSGPSGTLTASDEIWTKGVLWAYEHSLIPAIRFYNDEENSTRSDAVTYLWKLAGSPTEEASVRSVLACFTDVSPDSDYAPAVAWALENGITKGTTETTFSPDRICTRGQIVTFLYRWYTR